jgi:hypothetical protein
MGAAAEQGASIRVRRGRRDDVDAVQALVGRANDGARARFDRRTLGGLGSDVYVAVDASGSIRGAVALGYVRSVAEGRSLAVLDGIWVAAGWDAVATVLVAWMGLRVRRRGCDRVVVTAAAVSAPVATALAAEGFVAKPMLAGQRAPAA